MNKQINCQEAVTDEQISILIHVGIAETTIPKIANKLNKSPSVVRKTLNKFVTEGLLVRHDEARPFRYDGLNSRQDVLDYCLSHQFKKRIVLGTSDYIVDPISLRIVKRNEIRRSTVPEKPEEKASTPSAEEKEEARKLFGLLVDLVETYTQEIKSRMQREEIEQEVIRISGNAGREYLAYEKERIERKVKGEEGMKTP